MDQQCFCLSCAFPREGEVVTRRRRPPFPFVKEEEDHWVGGNAELMMTTMQPSPPFLSSNLQQLKEEEGNMWNEEVGECFSPEDEHFHDQYLQQATPLSPPIPSNVRPLDLTQNQGNLMLFGDAESPSQASRLQSGESLPM